MLHRTEGRSPGPPIPAGNVDDVGPCLRHADGDRPDPGAGDELHADLRRRVHLPQFVDQLFQILDAVHVVQRRRRNQVHVRKRMSRPGNVRVHLHAHQLSPLARLCSLRDFDLELAPRQEIFRGHAEPGRCNLLRGGRSPILEVVRVFPSLAAVAPSAEFLHRMDDVSLALCVDGAERHCAGTKRAEDLLPRLHTIGRERPVRFGEVKKMADADRFRIPSELEVFLVHLPLFRRGEIPPHKPMHKLRTGGGHRMLLTHTPADVFAELIRLKQFPAVFRLRGKARLPEDILCQLVISDAAERRGISREEILHQLGSESDRRKELRAHVALDNGDAALRHDFQQP